MKKMILLALALVTVAVSQAVTIKWYVPNSDSDLGEWTGDLGQMYFVYASDAITDSSDPDDIAAAAYNIATGGTIPEIITSVSTTYTPNTTGTKLGVYAPNLAAPTITDGVFEHEAYYYMVAVSKDPDPLYAVAGVGPITSTGQNGIYENSVGVDPTVGPYIDLDWLGGTWTAAIPEPTVMALLALGVAGMALRRKEKVL